MAGLFDIGGENFGGAFVKRIMRYGGYGVAKDSRIVQSKRTSEYFTSIHQTKSYRE